MTTCTLLNQDNHILLAQHPKNKSLTSLYKFPNNKMKHNKTPKETLIRKLNKELNIKTKITYLAPLTFTSHTYKTFHLL
ncbi:8-oxo-dGTP diphosphatase MutT, partial [Klebsiella pneumoniae]